MQIVGADFIVVGVFYTFIISIFNIILIYLADEIPKEDCLKMFDELAPKEDEDGFIPYKDFLDKLCGKA